MQYSFLDRRQCSRLTNNFFITMPGTQVPGILPFQGVFFTKNQNNAPWAAVSPRRVFHAFYSDPAGHDPAGSFFYIYTVLLMNFFIFFQIRQTMPCRPPLFPGLPFAVR